MSKERKIRGVYQNTAHKGKVREGEEVCEMITARVGPQCP
jgi:hypothetical protein